MRKLHLTLPRLVLLLMGLLIIAPTWAQDSARMPTRLTNQDVISMVQLGLSDDVIVAKIRAASAAGAGALSFDTSVDGLKALKAAKVSDAILKVMINPAPPAPATVVAATPMTIDPSLPPPEVGVYWKDGANFVLIPGQAVTQAKVGGRAGSFFTDGLRNQHWDAVLDGPTSRNRVRDRRPAFYFYVPDGASAADYLLIRVNKKGNRREFQVGSFGGITGGKTGVKRGKEVPFQAQHVGIRTYKISLDQDLAPGEYAFFMGMGQSAMMSGAMGGDRSGGVAAGRVYDFTIPE
ncbi:MAG TPA: hypothetical protein VG204_01450 [Terriglobia bacterium]|nr:hypothetical protein [Terriglobia bacterium]